jgi:hypothetical protein
LLAGPNPRLVGEVNLVAKGQQMDWKMIAAERAGGERFSPDNPASSE